MDLPKFRFVGNMPKVTIHGIGLGGTGLHINIVFLTIFNHLLATPEGLRKWHRARGENFKIWSKGGEGQLETTLIITLAGGTMGNGSCSKFAGDFNLSLQSWAGD